MEGNRAIIDKNTSLSTQLEQEEQELMKKEDVADDFLEEAIENSPLSAGL